MPYGFLEVQSCRYCFFQFVQGKSQNMQIQDLLRFYLLCYWCFLMLFIDGGGGNKTPNSKLYATCLICGKQLSNQYNLRVHMETHQNAHYACSSCSHVSRSRDALRKHVSYRHPQPPPLDPSVLLTLDPSQTSPAAGGGQYFQQGCGELRVTTRGAQPSPHGTSLRHLVLNTSRRRLSYPSAIGPQNNISQPFESNFFFFFSNVSIFILSAISLSYSEANKFTSK